MRTKRILTNLSHSVFAGVLVMVLGMLTRRLFIRSLDIRTLGYEGLFSNIFTLLSLSELGMSGIVSYRLYHALAVKDEKRIAGLMYIYRKAHCITGAVIGIVGMLMMPILHYIIKSDSVEWNRVYIFYLMQLIVIVVEFFSYRRIIFVADQREYACIKIETCITVLVSFVKMAVLIFYRSYELYLLINIIGAIVSCCFIYLYSEKDYPFLKDYSKVRLDEETRKSIFKDIKNNIVIRLCAVIYAGTDNIVITSALGLQSVGLFSNYLLISQYVTSLIGKITSPVQASIGNYNYTEKQMDIAKKFRLFEMLSFFLATMVSISYFLLFNPTISLWIGRDYLLSNKFVILFSVNQYIKYNHEFLLLYRNTVGRFEVDMPYILGGTILNLIISIMLVSRHGIVGVLLGTIVGHIGFWMGRVRVVYKELLKEGMELYIIDQVKKTVVFTVEMIGAYSLSVLCRSEGVVGIIQRIIVCLFLTGTINYFYYGKSIEMKEARAYLKRIIQA